VEENAQNFLSVEDVNEPGFRWTLKRHKFVRFYVHNGGDAKAAAEKAGFAESTGEAYGPHLLTQAPIRKAIQKLLRDLLRKEGLAEESIIAKWRLWTEGDAYDYVKEEFVRPLTDNDGEIIRNEAGQVVMDEQGPRVLVAKGPSELTKEQKARVKKISITNNNNGQNVSIEMRDADKAVDRLAEYLGILKGEGTAMGAEEAARLIRETVALMDDADGTNTTKH